VLEVRGISLRFGGVRALSEVNFSVKEGELLSIIGPNGAGKTSIVNCISGRYRPSEGKLFYRGHDITGLNPNSRASLGIGCTFQNLALFHHMSVLDNIMVWRHHLLNNNFITGSLYWLTYARREELTHRRKVEEIIDFLDLCASSEGSRGLERSLPRRFRRGRHNFRGDKPALFAVPICHRDSGWARPRHDRWCAQPTIQRGARRSYFMSGLTSESLPIRRLLPWLFKAGRSVRNWAVQVSCSDRQI